MTRDQSNGFTLMELIIVLVIASVLLSMAVGKIGQTRSVLAGGAARQAFLALHSRTRAQAIEFGTTARLMLDISGDSAWIVQGGETIETYRFANDHVDVESNSQDHTVQMCMIARGYSEPRCNSFTEPIELTFRTAESAASVVLLPMGQVKW
ncbi:MAG: prepilin-type N-terminal cleavage/methylation domain-containing protein [Gemmatimonadetes bacterium]|nr:prepilin-type N-terminal cleavage/methylation domain-containing protein [Gemmatimonadota bacterium]